MTYIPDLDPYAYWPLPEGVKGLAVGWLDESHTFLVGQPEDTLVRMLSEACRLHLVARTRGWMHCMLCRARGDGTYPTTASLGGDDLPLGSAEIWVIGEDGVWLCAPNMILHYVQEHHYLPPIEFVTALSAGRFAPDVTVGAVPPG